MKKVHFIAIGGAVMHNLALALHSKGYSVSGSDDEFFEPSRSRLAAKGLLPDATGWHAERITPDLDAVILGMHALPDNPELLRAQELGLKIYSFPEYLYEQTAHEKRIVVGGSHGKTTTTAMIMYVLRKCGVDFDYMVGAQVEGFETMVRLSQSAKVAVFEGDEYLTSPTDRRSKFLHYHPDIAILTGIAWDHVNVFPTFDSYVGQFRKFAESIQPGGSFIYCATDKNLADIASSAVRSDVTLHPYSGFEWHTDADGHTVASIDGHDVRVSVFGQHNMQNMQAAMLACAQVGISPAQFAEAISDFTGAARRLQLLADSPRLTAYLDFAHSPSKLRATVSAVRERYPDRKIVAAMELHTFSSLTKDFLPQYNGAMEKADVAIVYYNPDVLHAKHLAEFTPTDVSAAFAQDGLVVLQSSADVEAAVRREATPGCVLLLMSSGDFGGIDIKALVTDLSR
ncbi:MAG: peptidoglycan synthetase [Bacteroidales bacterium]|nr:peptidoglycan synthetase [Bacteroidales bacterium]